MGGRGASAGKVTQKKETIKITTFKGQGNYEKVINNGYTSYRGDDLRTGGSNYEEIGRKLVEKGYKVRVFEDTTRVRGLHKYIVLYK